MQGPFKVTFNPDIPGSRDSRKIETYGVFSGSDTTALRFGTTRDRIYVGHDDTSFNGLVKIDRIAEKNAGNSVKFENDIKMGLHQIKNLAEATDDKDAVTYGQVKQELNKLATPVDKKAIQAAGLQLGTFKYRRASDGFVSGSIKSNTTTDPKTITQLDIWHSNIDGVNFGKDFYELYVVPKMFVHIRDNGSGKYVGKITTVDMDALTNGVRLTLTPLDALTNGAVYYNNQYDVSIGYCRYGI